MRNFKLFIAIVLAGLLSACGGGGSSTPATTTPTPTTTNVTVGGKVYDKELSGAEVLFYVDGDTTPIAKSVTDSNGAYSVTLPASSADNAKSITIKVKRGKFKMRSLMGNVQDIIATAKSKSDAITSDTLPSANITNVSTAIAALIDQAGSTPASKAEIDAAVKAVDKDKVLKISAALKMVVDYGAGTDSGSKLTATNTDDLAKQLAAASPADLSTAVGDLVAAANTASGTTLTEQDFKDEVTNDPILAVQLPSDEAALATAMVNGNSYFILEIDSSGSSTGTIVKFDGAGAATAWSTGSMDTSNTGDYSVTNDVVTVNMPALGQTAAQTFVLTVKSGNVNSVFVKVAIDDVAKGKTNMRRIITVGGTTNSAGNIRSADAKNTILTDFKNSRALSTGTCDGSAGDSIYMGNGGSLSGVNCVVHGSGLLKFIPTTQSVISPVLYVGLQADSWKWDGTIGIVKKAMNMVLITDEGATSTPIASYERVFRARNVNTESTTKLGGPRVNRLVMRVDSKKNLSLRYVRAAGAGAGTTGDPTLAEIYMKKADKTLKLFQRKIVIGVADPKSFGATVHYSYNTIDDAKIAYSVNLGKHAGGLLNAIFFSNNNSTTYPTSLSNPLGGVNTRLLYKLSAITATDVFGTATTMSFTTRHLLNPTKFETLTFNRANNTATSGTVTIVDTNGSSTLDWAIATPTGAKLTVSTTEDYTGVSYTPTIILTDANGGKHITYMDRTTGTDSFVMGTYEKNNVGELVGVKGHLVTRN